MSDAPGSSMPTSGPETDGSFGSGVPFTPAPGPTQKPPRSGAVWFGIVLILLGATILLDQFIPGVDLWRLWPLIIVAMGVREMFPAREGKWTVKRPAEGISTIAFGGVLLACSIGYLSWSVWLNIFSLWPLLLVALGVQVIGKGLHNNWIRALSSLIVAAGLVYGGFFMSPTAVHPWFPFVINNVDTEDFDFTAPHDAEVVEGQAVIDAGVGEFSLEAGDDLATASGRSPYTPEFGASPIDGVADVAIGYGNHSWNDVSTDVTLDVTLDRDVVWGLDMSAGVTSYDLDLSDLLVSSLVLDAGVSQGTLTLGRSNLVGVRTGIPVEIKAGVSTLTIRVPEGDDARVSVSQGLSATDTRGSWIELHSGGRWTYESDGFSDLGPYWDVRVESGVGAITIEYY